MNDSTDSLQIKIEIAKGKLSENTRRAIESVDFKNIILSMREKKGRDPEQLDELETETELLLCGLIGPDEYQKELEKIMRITPKEMQELVKELNFLIFQNIYEKFVEITEGKKVPMRNISAQVSAPAPKALGEALGEEIPAENQIKNSNITQTTDPRLDTLPEGVLKIIEDSNYQNTLYEIAQDHKLSVTEMGSLDKVTTNLITGAIHPDEFKNALQKSLYLPKEETGKLVDEINERVFRKIRQKLVGLDGSNFTEGPKPFAEAEKVKAKLQEEDLTVLKTHGIDIIPEKLEIEEGKKPAVHPILAQKLSGPMQIPTIKSEHSASVAPATTPAPAETPALAPTPPAKKEPVSYTKNADPYREIPE